VATGHHARAVTFRLGARHLPGADALKDQSAVLHMLRSGCSRVLFPVGDLTGEVRGATRLVSARRRSPPAGRAITSGQGRSTFLGDRYPLRRRAVDTDGTVVGQVDASVRHRRQRRGWRPADALAGRRRRRHGHHRRHGGRPAHRHGPPE
jgi:hypothetical protein